MRFKFVKQEVYVSGNFKLTVIMPISHDLLEVNLGIIGPGKLAQLELRYIEHEYVSEKEIKKENWECVLVEKNTRKEVPNKVNTRLEVVREFKSDTHYLFRVLTIKH